jgi:hypothetical protein
MLHVRQNIPEINIAYSDVVLLLITLLSRCYIGFTAIRWLA